MTDDCQSVRHLVERCRRDSSHRANILKTLLAIQQALGYVPTEAVQQVAQLLDVTDADVAGVLSFYPDLKSDRPGRHVIRVCLGESCMANHCSVVLRAVRDYLGAMAGDAASEDRFTLEMVYCMGNCALSPTVVVDHDIYGRVEPSQIPLLLGRYR